MEDIKSQNHNDKRRSVRFYNDGDSDDKNRVLGHTGDHDFNLPVPFVTLSMMDNTNVASTSQQTPIKTTAFGFDHLTDVDRLFIQRLTSQFDFVTEMYINRRYRVMDRTGKTILWAGEGMDCTSRCWRGMDRRYCMYVFSVEKGELLFTIERRRLKCSRQPPIQEAVTANLPSISELNLANSTMQLANGEFIGQLRDMQKGCTLNFNIDDSNCIKIINIRGRCGANFCPLLSFRTTKFMLFDRQDNPMGIMEKRVELRSNDERKKRICSTVNFPGHLEPITKALILGAFFDLNITYFEKRCSWDGFVYVLLCIWVIVFITGAVFLLLWAIKS